MKLLILLLGFLLVLYSCGSKKTNYHEKYPYSIADFNPALRPYLEAIIQDGIVHPYGSNFDFILKHSSIKELQKLLKCEYPIIRAYGFSALITKDSNIVNQILFPLLNDDSSFIFEDRGEWGVERRVLADFYVYASQDRTKILISALADKLLTEHNHLQSAYTILDHVDSGYIKAVHYNSIKQMGQRPYLAYNDTEMPVFYSYKGFDLSFAVYKLAQFKKKEDIPLIKSALMYQWRLDHNYAFRTIIKFPDTSYFDVLQDYYQYISRPMTEMQRQINFNGRSRSFILDQYEEFLHALAAQKTKRSASILQEIIEKKFYPYLNYPDGKIKYTIYKLLEENYCQDYEMLSKRVEKDALNYKKRSINDSFIYSRPEPVGSIYNYW